jgi:hypothetical protein
MKPLSEPDRETLAAMESESEELREAISRLAGRVGIPAYVENPAPLPVGLLASVEAIMGAKE